MMLVNILLTQIVLEIFSKKILKIRNLPNEQQSPNLLRSQCKYLMIETFRLCQLPTIQQLLTNIEAQSIILQFFQKRQRRLQTKISMIKSKSKLNITQQQSSPRNIVWKCIGQKNFGNDQINQQKKTTQTERERDSPNNSLRHQRYNPSHSKSKQKHQIKFIKQVALRSKEKQKGVFSSRTKYNNQEQTEKANSKKNIISNMKSNYLSITRNVQRNVQYQIDANYGTKLNIVQNERTVKFQGYSQLHIKIAKLQEQNKKIKQQFINFKNKVMVSLLNQKQQIEKFIQQKIKDYPKKVKQFQSQFQKIRINSVIQENKQNHQTSLAIYTQQFLKSQTKKIGNYKNKCIAESKGNIITKALQQASQAEHQYKLRKQSLNCQKSNKKHQKSLENYTKRQKSFERIFSVLKNLQQDINCGNLSKKDQQNKVTSKTLIAQLSPENKQMEKLVNLKNQIKRGSIASVGSLKSNRPDNQRLQSENPLLFTFRQENFWSSALR